MGDHPHTRGGRIIPIRHLGPEGPTSARARTRARGERILREHGSVPPSAPQP
jgi:hypothetical protein